MSDEITQPSEAWHRVAVSSSEWMGEAEAVLRKLTALRNTAKQAARWDIEEELFSTIIHFEAAMAAATASPIVVLSDGGQ